MENRVVHNPLEGEKPEMVFNLHLHDGSEEQISIIIVHRNKPNHLNLLIQSIVVASFNNNYEIIVVDNGSDIESQNFLDEIKDEVKVVRNKENLYWSAAANKGAEVADRNSKYLLFMHCDVVVLHPNWLDILLNIAESKKSGLVGIETGAYIMNGTKIDFIQEWCMLVSRECWKEAGPFSTELPVAGHAFILSMSAQRKGFQPQCFRSPIAHHYRVMTQNANEFERMAEVASVTLPKLIRDIQNTTTPLKGL